MGWLSKTFGRTGDFFEDIYSPEGVAHIGIGTLIGGPVGGIIGAITGSLHHHQTEKAEAQQQAQIAAAQKLADMQDPSRVVQQATAAPQIQRQQQVNEVNEATAKSKKLTLAKMKYNTGLQSFSKLGSFNSTPLGGGGSTLG